MAEQPLMRSVRQWELWSLPRDLCTFLCMWAVLTSGCVAAALLTWRPATTGQWVLLALLIVVGCSSDWVAGRLGEAWDRTATKNGGVGSSTRSLWVFVGIVTLPLAHVTVLALVLLLFEDLRVRHRRAQDDPHPLYRLAFNAGASAAAAIAGSLAFDAASGGGAHSMGRHLLPMICAYVAMYLANQVPLLVVLTIATGRPYRPSVSILWASAWDQVALSSVGFLLAMAWRTDPLLILVGLPPAVLLHQALQHAQLREAAAHDPKTGLATAATWRRASEGALSRARTSGGCSSVLLVDLDHFKSVNDTYGHLAGDDVLTAVARSMEAAVRSGDLVGRFGGEEFAVLLPDADSAAAAAIAERIRAAIADLHIRFEAEDDALHVTASVGVAAYPADGSTLDEVLEQADRALYAAKHAGRDRVGFAADAAAPDLAPAADCLDEPISLPGGAPAERPAPVSR